MPRQVLGLGIDLAGDDARSLLPAAVSIERPVPVGAEPAALLTSAEHLLQRIANRGAWAAVDALRARVGHLVWEANTSVDG